jgi:LmbE family N-acetylglucosaminyl deacetylase
MRKFRSRLRRFLSRWLGAGGSDAAAALRRLPLVEPDELLGNRPVLILAPHPDDESLGCGGLIAECRARGHDVYVMIVTDGSCSHHSPTYPPERLAAVRAQEARDALRELDVPPDRLTFLGLRDGHAPLWGPRLRAAGRRVTSRAREWAIGTICTTWSYDPHPDHVATYRIARVAARAMGARLLCYPVWGWTLSATASPPEREIGGVRIDIARHLATKRRAVACHRSQMSDLIEDDPQAFRMPPEVLVYFDQPFEVFLNA